MDIVKLYEQEKKEPEWFWSLLDCLEWAEIYSMFRSNYIGRVRRNIFYHIYKPQRVIREFIPLMACVGVANVVMKMIDLQPTIKKSK